MSVRYWTMTAVMEFNEYCFHSESSTTRQIVHNILNGIKIPADRSSHLCDRVETFTSNIGWHSSHGKVYMTNTVIMIPNRMSTRWIHSTGHDDGVSATIHTHIAGLASVDITCVVVSWYWQHQTTKTTTRDTIESVYNTATHQPVEYTRVDNRCENCSEYVSGQNDCLRFNCVVCSGWVYLWCVGHFLK